MIPKEISLSNDVLKVVSFLENIGIPVVFSELSKETFLPGILAHYGTLIIDINKLKFPGDILHEAGHIAVLEPNERQHYSGDFAENKSKQNAGGDEIAAMAWSYAASVYLKLPPDFVFHPDGYKGNSTFLIETFESGKCLGLPLLQWMGLCLDIVNAEKSQKQPFPYMLKWMR